MEQRTQQNLFDQIHQMSFDCQTEANGGEPFPQNTQFGFNLVKFLHTFHTQFD